MPGLKRHHADVRFGNNKVTPDEMDMRQQYVVMYPSTSATFVGTSATGTAGQEKALTIARDTLDYPRNLLYSVQGTADVGGVWVVNGKDQFGKNIRESVTLATAAAGTPAAATAGTLIFSRVTSGTFTTGTASVGGAIGRIGVAIGSPTAFFGLPVKIKSTGDVKKITWIANGTETGINGGTVSGYVSTATHAFRGTAANIAATDIYSVDILTTYNSENEDNVS
jgi:hypothetical protein